MLMTYLPFVQVRGLQFLSSKDVLTNGLIPFYPLHGTKVTQETYDLLDKVNMKKLYFKGTWWALPVV